MKKGGRVAGLIDVKDKEGKGYRGYPNSPTTDIDSAVSARKRGGKVTLKAGGRVKGLANGGPSDDGGDDVEKMQFGGGTFGSMPGGGPGAPGAIARPGQQGGLSGMLGNIPGRTPTQPIQGPPTISGRPMIPAQPVTVPMPATLSSFRSYPAPGTRVGFSKKGGSVKHSDEAEDKKLFKRMYKAEEAKEEKAGKRKRGGAVNPGSNQPARGQAGSSYHNWGEGYQAGGIVKTPLTNATGGGAGGKGRLAKTRAAKKVPDRTEA